MVAIWLLLLLALLLAKSLAMDFNYKLPKAVLEHLNTSSSQFDDWTRELSENLSTAQQQQLAWNVQFLDTPQSAMELRELQKKLSPSNDNRNPLKLWLWIRFYWQLRRSQRLDVVNMLLPHFALTLRHLRHNSQWQQHEQVQNMLQSLPRFLIDLVASRWLCLKHNKDQLYLLPGGALQLGTSSNSNCSMWQVQFVAESQHFLRLQNACEEQDIWFINMLHTDSQSQTYMLLDAAISSKALNSLCQQHGVSYLQQGRIWDTNCQWQLNDCTQLPKFLSHLSNRHS